MASRIYRRGKAVRRAAVVEPWGNVRRDLRAAVARANRNDTAVAKGRRPLASRADPVHVPNDLRRTFASWLVQNDVPLLTVATLLGHSSTRMVEKVYGKLSAKNMDNAIAVLPAFGLATVTTVCAQARICRKPSST